MTNFLDVCGALCTCVIFAWTKKCASAAHMFLGEKMIFKGNFLGKLKMSQKQSNSDMHVLYKLVNNYNGDMSDIKNLVEKGVKNNQALDRALECAYNKDKNFIDLAIYLKNNGMFLDCKNLPLSCLETMKLVTEWGYKYEEGALEYITLLWNGGDVLDRVKYLYDVLNYQHLASLKVMRYVKEDVFCFLIDHCSVEMEKLMEFACNSHFFLAIHALIKKGLTINDENAKLLMSSDNFDELFTLIDIDDLSFSYIIDDGEKNTKKLQYYYDIFGGIFLTGLGETIDKLYCGQDYDAIKFLVSHGVYPTYKQLWMLFNAECENFSSANGVFHEFSNSLSLIPCCEEAIDILEDLLSDMTLNTHDLEKMREIFGTEKTTEYLAKLNIDEKSIGCNTDENF